MSPTSRTHDSELHSNPEEVIRLFCPQCSGKLNLRRKHIGVAGNCVHCKTPVQAVDHQGVVALVHKAGEQNTPADPAVPGTAAPGTAAPGTPVPEQATTAAKPTPPSAPESETAPPQAPEPSPAPPRNAPATESKWGFPEPKDPGMPNHPLPKEDAADGAVHSADSPETPPASPAPLDLAEETEPTPPSLEEFPPGPSRATSPAAPNFAASSTLPEPGEEEAHAETAAAEAAPEETSASELPPIEPATEDPPSTETSTASPSSISDSEEPESKEEKITESTDSDLFDFGGTSAKSALFDSPAAEAGIHSGWGTKVPNQNHASISPFSTGSSIPEADDAPAPGFAETLFKNGKDADDSTPTASPAESSPAPASSGGASPSPFAEIGEPHRDENGEVVLDGDGRPMAPMTDEEKDAFAREMMHLGDYHKQSPWVKRIRRFLLTIVLLAGAGYAAYVFMPADLAKDSKNKALTWLEPGSVLLDFLPFEITDDPEGEEGDKTVKVKAVEGLNQLNDEFSGYLDAADENLRESGAKVEEREKTEHMEGPNLPKLPFNLPNSDSLPERPGVDSPSVDSPGVEGVSPPEAAE